MIIFGGRAKPYGLEVEQFGGGEASQVPPSLPLDEAMCAVGSNWQPPGLDLVPLPLVFTRR